MKAYRIRRIRKKLLGYRKYIVVESDMLNCYSDCSYQKTILAKSEEHAIKRFLKKRERKTKIRRFHNNYKVYEEPSYFSEFMVIDENGYKRFYR